MVSFPPVSPPRPYTNPLLTHTSHVPSPSHSSRFLSPAQYWVSFTNHLAPCYAISSIPPYLDPPRSKYSPQHHVLKHPHLPFLPQCQRPSFTPIQNNGQNYSSIYLDLYIFLIATWKTKGSAPNDSKHFLISICPQFLLQ